MVKTSPFQRGPLACVSFAAVATVSLSMLTSLVSAKQEASRAQKGLHFLVKTSNPRAAAIVKNVVTHMGRPSDYSYTMTTTSGRLSMDALKIAVGRTSNAADWDDTFGHIVFQRATIRLTPVRGCFNYASYDAFVNALKKLDSNVVIERF